MGVEGIQSRKRKREKEKEEECCVGREEKRKSSFSLFSLSLLSLPLHDPSRRCFFSTLHAFHCTPRSARYGQERI